VIIILSIRDIFFFKLPPPSFYSWRCIQRLESLSPGLSIQLGSQPRIKRLVAGVDKKIITSQIPNSANLEPDNETDRLIRARACSLAPELAVFVSFSWPKFRNLAHSPLIGRAWEHLATQLQRRCYPGAQRHGAVIVGQVCSHSRPIRRRVRIFHGKIVIWILFLWRHAETYRFPHFFPPYRSEFCCKQWTRWPRECGRNEENVVSACQTKKKSIDTEI